MKTRTPYVRILTCYFIYLGSAHALHDSTHAEDIHIGGTVLKKSELVKEKNDKVWREGGREGARVTEKRVPLYS